MKRRNSGVLILAATLALGMTGCGLVFRHHNADLGTSVASGEQPDKILYDRAANEIQHSRYDVGRLTLQTLLNTYPDSEYLAKAKLAIADSYYKEGGITGLTQAEAEYKDFITFFPTAPEAPESQFRAAMCHFRLMGKPDRDRTEARLAEAELKEFLLKYPDNRLMPLVKARLRETQQVLGESDFAIAQYYYLQHVDRAARSRFQEIADDYPNFSQADSAMWYLGQTLERLKTPKDASLYYSQLLTEYPLSPHADEAKRRLAALHQPIPRPTRAILARAQADRTHEPRPNLFAKMGGVFSSAPDVSATRHGPVNLGAKAGQVEAAKTQPAPGINASIVAQPVNDSSLNSGKTVESKAGAGDPTAKPAAASQDSGTTAQAQANSKPAEGGSGSSTALPPAKKKGRFHIFKKIVKPF